jgi:uncharacterized membrane protein
MSSHLILALALLGIVAGLRALTPAAAVSWAAYLHWIHLEGTHLSFMGSIIAVVIFTLLAIFEIVNDKLPKTPPRTAPPSFVIRILLGAFAAACLATGMGVSHLVGALLGAVGAVVGTLVGYQARTKTVAALHTRDLPIALVEDAIAICLAFFLVWRF